MTPISTIETAADVVPGKLARLSTGKRPRVLDLFAGCGGISLGFQAAGYEISAAVENDELAAASHGRNFFGDHRSGVATLHSKARDITATDPEQLCQEFGLGPASRAFDFVVGGPPCQAYARVGRAKLREVAEHPTAFKIDPRGNLYLRYLNYIEATCPLGLLMENVPDILNYGGHNIVEEMVEALDRLGYDAAYTLLNSAYYGVPQMRDRVFLVGFRKELNINFDFPSPTHWLELPSGYIGSRAVATKNIDLMCAGWRIPPGKSNETVKPAVSAHEAIGDLPKITAHLTGGMKRGARRFDELTEYQTPQELSDFANEMRSWTGFENSVGVFDHVIRFLPRDAQIFKHMREGAEYPEANRVAISLFEQELARRQTQSGIISEEEALQLRRAMVPPYPTNSFPNRWWKLRRDAPVRTLMAHIGKDTYSHIHYDSDQARVISVREAARLQSFPDGFRFEGTMNPAYRQIGNAVPPLMAKVLATKMWSAVASKLPLGRMMAEAS